jgi:phosphoserine phosphatase
MSRPLAVFAYDFDGTLARGNMQEHAFIPDELGMAHADFWRETQVLAEAQRGDPILTYMHLMLAKARDRSLELTLDSWRKRGAALRLFPGVEAWFARQNARAAALGLDLRHFIISSGNRELIEGSPIAHEFERIYASAFLFNERQEAVGPALAINYTGKTQYLFRINKWTLNEWDNDAINAVVPEHSRTVPFERIAFFGDGLTDIPVMRVMTDHGGHPVAVYDPEKPITEAAAGKLLKDGRARLAAGGDYRQGSELDALAAEILTEMARGVTAELFG